MKQPKFEGTFFERNREKIRCKLNSKSIAIVHSNDEMPRNGDQFYPYRQNSDLLYLTGIEQANTILVICSNQTNASCHETLFINKPDKTHEIWNGKLLSKSEASEISGIKNIRYIENFESTIHEIICQSETIYLNSNENTRFASDVASKDIRFAKEIGEKYPLHKFNRLAPILANHRTIKEHEEIACIKYAASITENAFRRVLERTEPNIPEYVIEAEISYSFRCQGARNHAYYPIVASGENACTLHYIENNKICQDGELILLDFGAEYNNYAADCSRTIPVNGKFSPRQKELYQSTLNVFNKIRDLMRSGTTIAQLNKQTCEFWTEEHLKLGLYSLTDIKHEDKSNPLVSKYFPHGVGHFLGLDVHDLGSKYQTLEPGMVLTCEPGIYIPEEKTGIRIENNILITEDAPIDLMNTIPIEVDEIEYLMNKK